MQNELRSKELTELCDLLVEKTMQLLKTMEQRSEHTRVQELKTEVEAIQNAIQSKKGTRLP